MWKQAKTGAQAGRRYFTPAGVRDVASTRLTVYRVATSADQRSRGTKAESAVIFSWKRTAGAAIPDFKSLAKVHAQDWGERTLSNFVRDSWLLFAQTTTRSPADAAGAEEDESREMPTGDPSIANRASYAVYSAIAENRGPLGTHLNRVGNQLSPDGADDYDHGTKAADVEVEEAQRAKAIRILKAQPAFSVGAVAARVVVPLRVLFGETAAKTIGDHYEEIVEMLSVLPTDQHLWDVAVNETDDYWREAGGVGGWVSAEVRYDYLRLARARMLAEMSPEDRAAAEAALAEAGPALDAPRRSPYSLRAAVDLIATAEPFSVGWAACKSLESMRGAIEDVALGEVIGRTFAEALEDCQVVYDNLDELAAGCCAWAKYEVRKVKKDAPAQTDLATVELDETRRAKQLWADALKRLEEEFPQQYAAVTVAFREDVRTDPYLMAKVMDGKRPAPEAMRDGVSPQPGDPHPDPYSRRAVLELAASADPCSVGWAWARLPQTLYDFAGELGEEGIGRAFFDAKDAFLKVHETLEEYANACCDWAATETVAIQNVESLGVRFSGALPSEPDRAKSLWRAALQRLRTEWPDRYQEMAGDRPRSALQNPYVVSGLPVLDPIDETVHRTGGPDGSGGLT
ncbi:hypothetical protein AB0E69_04195 [Kribbella sp. NPDC026611]|uniref:hypothetical protein n=1 Tax=Kribbella sp. NPDC026611 TaxID=3154911 RepID=UPI0033F6F656